MKGKRKMIATVEVERAKEQEEFIELVERFNLAVNLGQETRASAIQMEALAKYGVWIK